MQIFDDKRDLDLAMSKVGPDAKPTGRIRLVQEIGTGMARLQQEWRGMLGETWIDVPIAHVHHMPQRSYGS